MAQKLAFYSVLLSLLLSFGCSGIAKKPLVEPKVQVRDFEITDVSLLGIDGKVTLRVDNPNEIRLSASGLSYTMSISGSEILTGQDDQSIAIPAFGSEEIELPMRLSYLALLETLPEVMQSGVADYKVTGRIKTNVFKTIPFSKTGKFELPIKPKF